MSPEDAYEALLSLWHAWAIDVLRDYGREQQADRMTVDAVKDIMQAKRASVIVDGIDEFCGLNSIGVGQLVALIERLVSTSPSTLVILGVRDDTLAERAIVGHGKFADAAVIRMTNAPVEWVMRSEE